MEDQKNLKNTKFSQFLEEKEDIKIPKKEDAAAFLDGKQNAITLKRSEKKKP